MDIADDARPRHPIAYTDDRLVAVIEAERFDGDEEAPRYDVEVAW